MACCCVKKSTKVQDINVEHAPEDKTVLSVKLPVDDDFDGPIKKRGCTDIFFLLLFIAFIGGMGFFAYRAFVTGNPNKLLYGTDSWGNVCGQPNELITDANYSGYDMTGKENVYYFDFSAVTNPLVDSLRVCVTNCPSNAILDLQDSATNDDIALCRPDKAVASYPATSPLSADDECPGSPILPHRSLVNRCVPEALITVGRSVVASFGGILNIIDSDFVSKVTSDVANSWKEILYMCAIAFGISFILTFMLQFFACVIIWVMVIGAAVGSLAVAGYTWYEWVHSYKHILLNVTGATPFNCRDLVSNTTIIAPEDCDQANTWLIYASVATVLAIIICLIMLVMRKRIALVVQLFREAGKALGKMPLLLFLPFITLIVLIGAIAGLLYIYAFMQTSAAPHVDNDIVTYITDQILFYTKWYHIFGMLWITQFILACQQMVIAGAVAVWYFQRDKSKIGCPICISIGRLIRCHLGSVAFGSLIIAIVQLIRLILGYIQKQAYKKPGVSKVMKYILKCLQFVLWCVEKLLKYVNTNAYIEISIYGCSFCKGAKNAFLLLVANVLRVAAITSVGFLVLFLAKIGTTAVVAVVGFQFMKLVQTNIGLNYFYVPIVFACAFGFFISHCFMQVYEMTIDTIFLCFCEDCQRNDGVRKPYFMSMGLMKYVENSKEAMAAAKEKKKQKQRRRSKPTRNKNDHN